MTISVLQENNTTTKPLNQNKMKQTGLKTCYCCHLDKNKSEMQEIGVWVCNQCLDKSKTPVKKSVKSE